MGVATRRARGESRRGPPAHANSTFFQPLPHWLWWGTIALAVLGIFTANPLLTAISILTLPLLASLLWFQGEPPALLFACTMQWLQAAVAIFYANYYGMPLSQQSESGGAELVQATWLSLIGVLVLAIGMKLALLGHRYDVASQAVAEARLLQPSRLFILHLVAFVAFSAIGRVAWKYPGLTQPLLATATLKWVLVFLLAYSVLMQRRNYALLVIVAGLEFFIGLLGVFAEFKSILFMLLVVMVASTKHQVAIKGWRLAQFCALAAFLFFLGVVWTAIKMDYRKFLNQGTGQQAVLVPVTQRLDKLSELASGLDRAKLEKGLEQQALRISYVQMFALAIANVPSKIPFENGTLWWGAIQHVLMPRFLFPDKPAINDSYRTRLYTGLKVAGPELGTSIGIGYMGESYIDFGPVGMFAPILLLGLFYGFIYRFFLDYHPIKVVGFAIATSILIFGAYTIEISNSKLIGGNLMSLLVMGLFAKFAGGRFWRMVTNPVAILPVRR